LINPNTANDVAKEYEDKIKWIKDGYESKLKTIEAETIDRCLSVVEAKDYAPNSERINIDSDNLSGLEKYRNLIDELSKRIKELESDLVHKTAECNEVIRRCADAESRVMELASKLEDVRDYFDQRADADAVGDPFEFKPNEEMRMLTEINKVIRKTR